MIRFRYILAAIAIVCATPKAPAMITKEQDLAKNAALLQAHVKTNKVPSLKALVAKKVINWFDPSCTIQTIEQLKALRATINRFPTDLQDHLFKTILKQKPAILEQILNAQPIELTGWDAHGISCSPDSNYLLIRARRKPLAAEPFHLIKVNPHTLATEELAGIEDVDSAIAMSSRGQEIALSTFTNNDTKFRVSLYNVDTKQARLLLQGNNPFIAQGYYLSRPKVFFNSDDSYITVVHQRKSYIINLSTEQLTCPILDGEAIPLDNTRVLVCDTREKTSKVITIHDGKLLFTTKHTTAAHCSCWPACDVQKQHLYTVSENTLNVLSLNNGSILKQIVFEHPISAVNTTTTGKKLRIALMKEEFAHDVVEVDIDTGAYKLRAQSQCMPPSLASCRASISNDSLFYINHSLREPNDLRGMTSYTRDGNLLQHHPPYRLHSLSARVLYPHLSPDNSFIYAETALDGRGTERMTYVKLLTHRALTNNTPLKDILALLILERQKKNSDNRDGQLWGDLLVSTNPLLRDLADKRYTNSWKEGALKYLSYYVNIG